MIRRYTSFIVAIRDHVALFVATGVYGIVAEAGAFVLEFGVRSRGEDLIQ